METKSLKALAVKVLQGNSQGKQTETKVFQMATFCSWVNRNVSDCQEPCLENDAGIVTRECPHFTAWWGERAQWLKKTKQVNH